jgi:hypothetical protein
VLLSCRVQYGVSKGAKKLCYILFQTFYKWKSFNGWQWAVWLTFNFKIQTSDCPDEKHLWKSSTNCLRSCRRGWNIQCFVPHDFKGSFRNALGPRTIYAKTLDWWPLSSRWRRKSFEKCHCWWRDVSLWLWRWNQTTILTLYASCFASSKESTSDRNALCFFFIIEASWIMISLLKVKQLIKIFIRWFWDICGLRYEEGNLKCGLREAGSSIMIMHLLTQCCQLDNYW